MADEPISALTLYTSFSTVDEVEILDVSDTTFASTGTNKRIQFSTLLTMAGVGTVAGGGTGLTSAGSADQLLGMQHVGGGLEYKTLTAGANITNTPGAGEITIAASGGGGGSGTVTSVGLSLPPFVTVTGSPVSTSGTLTGTLATQTANTHFAGPTSGSAAAPTFRALVAADLPSITYGAIQNESASTILGNPTGSPASPSEIGLYPNLGFVGSSLRGSVPIWAATGPGTALVSSSALTSILTGAPSIGSLTIPANTLQIGNRLRFALFGAYSVTTTSSPTLTVKLLLGGTVIAQGTSSAAGSNQSNLQWMFYDTILGHYVQATGSSGKIIGLSMINVPNFFSLSLNNSGSGTGTPSQVTINTTTSLAIDVQMQWSVASTSDSIQLLGGAIYLD